MRIWGVTGTNGKTTTTWILAEMLRAAGRPTAHVTTVEVNTLKRTFSSGYTTPPLNVLRDIFTESAMAGAQELVMEVSSHAIYQRRTGDTIFAGAIFTNLTEDHLDYHKTMEAYYQAKKLLFMRMAAESPSGTPVVICTDGDYGQRLARELKETSLRVITCGLTGNADVTERDYDFTALPLVGRYNRQNVLCAAALAQAAGVPRETIQATIPCLTPRWGRLEYVRTASRAKVYVDFAHTDDALENVLGCVAEMPHGKIWAVFGAGGDRDRAKRPLMGAAAARHADRLVVTSDNPRSEKPEDIIAEIVAGIPAGHEYVVEPDRAKAIHYALSEAAEGDIVVICGKGHETTQTIGDKVIPFDDRVEAARFIRS